MDICILLASFLSAAVLVPQPTSLTETGGFAETTNVTDRIDPTLPDEGYRLSIAKDGVTVTSKDDAGRFYARQTLRQLMTDEGRYPCVEIADAPAFRWRGVMLDEGRHFFGKEEVKRILDLMAQHKYNVFHWHLTEDQGWRLDVPGYPELVRYGAVRPASPKHDATIKWIDRKKDLYTMDLDDATYGPFYYTEADIREIVEYAAARHIDVVPEIEFPGHVCAALAAYPEFACRPENLAGRHPRLVWGIEKEVLCLGNDRALKFMEDVIDYVCRIFPSRFIHIGGDECPSEHWKDCPRCRARRESEGLDDEKALQPWITRRIVRQIESRGKRAIGWDEYLAGDVPLSAVGIAWRNPKKHKPGEVVTAGQAAAKGHDMVVALSPLAYLSRPQGLEDDPFQYSKTAALTLEEAYGFDPLADVPESARPHILGGQACNWTEYTWNRDDLAWKMWPRACAIAEVLWCGGRKPGYGDFIRRMATHRRRLLRQGVNCAPLK